MAKVLHARSTLTERYQTTIPEVVREALHLGRRDKIEFSIENDGKVVLTKADQDDPILGNFLTFLAQDIAKHPEHIRSMDPDLVTRAKLLVSGMNVDLDAPLSDEDE